MNIVRRDVSRNITRHIREDGRVSLKQHLFGNRSKSLVELSPLTTTNGISARVKGFFGVLGITSLVSAVTYTAFMHPDVQFDKDERQQIFRDTRAKARRFASHRNLASHSH